MRFSVGAVSLALVAAACGGGDSDVPEIKQAGFVAGLGRGIQSVSPDGLVLVVADGEHVGIQPLDGGDPVDVPAPNEFSLQRMVGGWTSDGSTVAFHDQLATATTFDSTVWLLNAAQPSLREVIVEQDIVLFDVAVAPDGSVIALSGVSGSGPARVHGVFTVQGSDEPKLLAEFEAEVIEWLPDGASLLMTGFTDESVGLWRVDRSDGGVELVTPADDVLGHPRLVSVSDDGTWALVHYLRYVAREFPANVSHFGVVDLETGDVSALKAQGRDDFFGPMLAVFSPDGKRVAYVYHDGRNTDAPLVLAIRPTVGGQEQIISGDLFVDVGFPPTPDNVGLDPELRPVWTNNDRLVLPTRAWALVMDME